MKRIEKQSKLDASASNQFGMASLKRPLRVPVRIKEVGMRSFTFLMLIAALITLSGCPAARKHSSELSGQSPQKESSEPSATSGLSPKEGEKSARQDYGQSAASQPSGTAESPQPSIPPSQETPEQILAAMVETYKKARSYGDQGRIVMRGTFNAQPFENRSYYLTAFERPNKLRLIAGEGGLICNGNDLWGFVNFLPGQVLKTSAPDQFTLETLFRDTVLANALMQGPGQVYSLVPPPLVLLLADDPLKTFSYRAKPPELLPPGTMGNFTCDRIRLARADGDVILWIDRSSRLLVRVDFPVESIRRSLDGGQLQSLAIYADFTNAVLDADIDPAAFQFQAPPDSRITEELHPHGYDYLGTQPQDFQFQDVDGKLITRETLAGKPVVLEFWSKNHPYSQVVLKMIQVVHDQFKDRATFYAISIDAVTDTLDSRAVANQELMDLLQSWNVTIPLLRDPQNDAEKCFDIYFRREGATVPCLVILNSEGVVQAYHLGSSPDLIDRLGSTLEKLLSGVNLVEEEKAGFEKMKNELARLVAESAKHGLFAFPVEEITAAGTTEAAKASPPKQLRLAQLFHCPTVKSPGNLTIIEVPNRDPIICVVENGNTATELSWDGQIKSQHPLKPTPPDKIDFLRTVVDAQGRRFFAAWSLGSQKVYFFDQSFAPLTQYPGENSPPHDGVADVHLVDLQGDGTIEAVVGFLGLVGVQAITLDGQRLWANRTAAAAFRIGILGPDVNQHRSVLATNTTRGSAVQISHDGQRLKEIIVPGRTIAWLAVADLNGDGRCELCGLDPKDYGQVEAFGFDFDGQELWSYKLPKGMSEYPVEQVTFGRLLPNQNTQQWLIVGADGSIHILDYNGQPIDQFNVGELITGVAVSQFAGKPALLVATPQAVVAWSVEAYQPQTP
ncbi:MAG: redoxin domain-containing protein [Thermogutta sp.]